MSPDENDLRAALRRGVDGTTPDPDRVIRRAREQRAHRRKLIGSVGAAVVLVVGVGVGVPLAVEQHEPGIGPVHGVANGPAVSGPSSSVPGEPSPRAGSNAVRTGSGTARSGAGTASCPAEVPVQPSAERFQTSSSPIFDPIPDELLVCGYDSFAAGGIPAHVRTRQQQVLLDGADAQDLARSLNAASPVPLRMMCPQYVSEATETLAIYPVTTSGLGRPVITTTGRPACQVVAQRGTVRRYGWTPPTALVGRLPSRPDLAVPSGTLATGTASGGAR